MENRDLSLGKDNTPPYQDDNDGSNQCEPPPLQLSLTEGSPLQLSQAAEFEKPIQIFSHEATFDGNEIDLPDDISRNKPATIFSPDDRTDSTIDRLFDTVVKVARLYVGDVSEFLSAVDLSRLPFGRELKEFFTTGDDDSLTKEKLRQGLSRIAVNFIGRNREIQDRANAYVVNKIGFAEMAYFGNVRPILHVYYEEAQLQLLLPTSFAVPDTPSVEERDSRHTGQFDSTGRVNFGHSTTKATLPPMAPSLHRAAPSVPQLFRSESVYPVNEDEYGNEPLFELQTETRTAIYLFFQEFFRNSGFVDFFEDFSEQQRIQLAELFTFFDFDGDDVVYRADLIEGLSNMAVHFIARDPVCQEIANTYLRWKIDQAIFKLESITLPPFPPSFGRLLPGGAREITPVDSTQSFGGSECLMTTGDVQDTEVSSPPEQSTDSGVPLLLPALFFPGSMVYFIDAENIYRLARIKQFMGNFIYRVDIAGGAVVIDVHEERLVPLQLESLKTASEQGGVWSSDMPEGPPPYSPARLSLSRQMSSPNRRGMRPANCPVIPSFTDMKLFDHQRAEQSPDLVNTTIDGPLVDNDNNSFMTSVVPKEGLPNQLQKTQKPHDEGRNEESTLGGDVDKPSTTTNKTSNGNLPLLVDLRNTLGPAFRLSEDMLPPPIFSTKYWLRFGTRKFFFTQRDYGIFFKNFLGPDLVQDQSLVQACPSALERLRCMFIHLGVGVGVHPFILQLKFRNAARRILSLPEDNLTRACYGEAAETVMAANSDVDISILNAVWPAELNGHRFMVASFEDLDRVGEYTFQSVVVFTPDSGPFDETVEPKKWCGKDVILNLKGDHFTLLVPNRQSATKWSEYPIDDVVSTIKSFNEGLSAYDAVCLVEYQVGEYLHQAATKGNNDNA